jgi:hypothetical protein
MLSEAAKLGAGVTEREIVPGRILVLWSHGPLAWEAIYLTEPFFL